MARFDPKQVSVLLSGQEISDWSDGGDVIDAKHSKDAGAHTIGANGSGVFIADPDRSLVLTLKIKQHSPDNVWLAAQKRLQQSNLRAFVPITLQIRDLLNEDQVTAQKGYFTTLPQYTRGTSHNATTWVVVFESGDIRNEAGIGN